MIILDKYQQAAAGFFGGSCMVLAGPGSGKTTVLVKRILTLVETYKVPSGKILVITFSKAAALEMQSRFLALSGGRYEDVVFGTFHAVFFRILSEYYGINGKDVITEAEKRRILREILEKTYPETAKDREFSDEILREISVRKNSGREEKNTAKVRSIDIRKLERLYEEKVRRERKLDFDDMLLMTRALFKSRPDVLAYWQSRFSYICVDEFQDINPVQYEIIRLLALPENNLFVVGDDDQSIYAFRGARPDIMLNFPKDYPKSKRIDLEMNYRSAPCIVEASLKVIGRNRMRYRKQLKAGREFYGCIEKIRCRDAAEEAEKITAAVGEEMKAGVPPEKIAVLVRTGRSADLILSAFTAKHLPFHTRDRVPNIYEHEAAAPVFAYLNYISGDHSRKNFLKFMNCPVRYIRREDLTDENVDLDALREYYRSEPERQWMADRVDFLAYQLDMLKRFPEPFMQINFIRRAMEYDRHLALVAEKKHTDVKELLGVLDTIEADAKQFTSTAAWYRHIVAYTKALYEGKHEEKEDREGKVTVCTLHAAKGLEFMSVYIADCVEGVIPHEKALKDGEIEEERRLFYVGMTRAIKNLRLYSVDYLHGKKTEISRFIREIN